jgi:hypothetical protein
MKILTKLIILSLFTGLIFISNTVEAYVKVNGYYKKNGTYVAPYVRSNPNGLKYDNYSYTPSQGLYNSTYGTKGSNWDTPTYITDPYYYVGKSLYESKSPTLYPTTYTTPTYKPTVSNTSYLPISYTTPKTTETVYKPVSVIVPENAREFGSTWYCKDGYKTIYDKNLNKTGCEKIIAPENSYIMGETWNCVAGYEIVYNTDNLKSGCKKKVIPANAMEFGSTWYCNMGYVNVYDKSYNKVGCELKKD